MADKGRDLKVSVLSDADQFDLGRPADDLDHLADSAQAAGRELSQLAGEGDQLASIGSDATGAADDLDRIGRAARDSADDVDKLGRTGDQLERLGRDSDQAGQDVKGLGTDATAAAAKIDGAFDKIAAASKRAGDKVDKSMDEGGRALDDFKDEAASSGTEAAASFSGGFDDVTDFLQETVANGLASVGKVGMAAGIAAAAGIGFLTSAISAANEKVQGIRQSLVDLQLEGLDDTRSKVQAVLDEMRDTDSLARFAQASKDAGIDFSEYVRALALGGPEAEAMKARLEELTGAQLGFATIAGDGKAAHDLINRLGDQSRASELAAIETEALTGAMEGLPGGADESSVAIQGLATALDGFTSPASVYSELLSTLEQKERDRAAAVAKGTKDNTDDWSDYAKSVDVSVGDYIAALERQVTAQEQWAGNLAKLARRGVSEGTLAELEKLGPQGAPLVAKLTTASDAELGKLVSLMRRKGADASGQLAQGIAAGKPGVAGEVSGIKEDMRRRLASGVSLPVKVTPPPAGQASAIRRDVQNNLRPVEIPVMLRSVPTSTWSRYIP
jgi:hypothetical protein